MAYTIYWGYSGGTLTVSGTKTSAAGNTWTASDQTTYNLMKVSPPWHDHEGDIKTINFVNSPHFDTFQFKGITGDSPIFNGYGLKSLTTVKGTVNATGCTNLGNFLKFCSTLKTVNLSNWSVGNVTTIADLFMSCPITSLTMTGFNFSSLTEVGNVFRGSDLVTLNLTGCKFPKLASVNAIFSRTTFLIKTTALKTVNLTNVEFTGATDAGQMLRACTALTSLTTTGMKLGKATDLSYMLAGCTALTSANLSGITVSSATSLSHMFQGCTKLSSVNLTGWGTGNVTTMDCMFHGCSALSSITGLAGFSKTKLQDVSSMFYNCTALKSCDLSAWVTPALTKASYMLYGCTSLTSVKVAGWSAPKLEDATHMLRKCTALASVTFNGWNVPSLTAVAGLFYGCTSLTSVTLSGWTTGAIATASSMFRGCTKIASIDAHTLDLSACTSLADMFYGCIALTSLDLHGLTLTECTTCANMFYGCILLQTLDVSGWSVPKLTTTNRLFSGLLRLASLDLSTWSFANVTDMGGMFYGCVSLTTVDLRNANTSLCVNFSQAAMFYTQNYMPMFRGCDNLTTVILGPGFTTERARARDNADDNMYYSRLELAPAVNLTNGIYAASDDDLAQLRSTEIAGTWHLGGEQMLQAFAYRTEDGRADQQGLDITIDCTWRTDSEETTRELRAYIKDSTATDYPTTPARSLTLSGDAGNTVIVLSAVGSGNYDLRVEFYDGVTTYVVFPSISTDTMLFSISPQGNARVLGNLEVGGTFTMGTTAITEQNMKDLLALLSS